MRLAVIGVALLIGGALLAGCSTAVVRPSGMTKAGCVHRAKLAMRDADFTEQLAVAGDGRKITIRGRHGDYRAELDCARGRETIGVVVTGPDPDQTARYRDSITRRF
jgi:hypothetical protein